MVTMDDATSKIYSAFLVEEEGMASTFNWRRQKWSNMANLVVHITAGGAAWH